MGERRYFCHEGFGKEDDRYKIYPNLFERVGIYQRYGRIYYRWCEERIPWPYQMRWEEKKVVLERSRNQGDLCILGEWKRVVDAYVMVSVDSWGLRQLNRLVGKDPLPRGSPRLDTLLQCPITLQKMRDPVILVGDGWSYERSAITQWLSQREVPRSPMTNLVIDQVSLIPNRILSDILFSTSE